MLIQDSLEEAVSKNGKSRKAGGASSPAETPVEPDRGPSSTTLLRVRVDIVGITPLLMNRMSEEGLEKIRAKIKSPKNAARPSPREECEPKVHLRDGKPAVPAQCILSTLINAGKYVRLDGKRQLSTAQSTMLPAFMSLEDPFCMMFRPGTKEPATWEVDLQQGRNPNGGEIVAICRPRFDQWAFSTTIQIDASQIGENVIRELWDIAGRRVGLLDYRPQRKGIYGQFRVDRWSTIK